MSKINIYILAILFGFANGLVPCIINFIPFDLFEFNILMIFFSTVYFVYQCLGIYSKKLKYNLQYSQSVGISVVISLASCICISFYWNYSLYSDFNNFFTFFSKVFTIITLLTFLIPLIDRKRFMSCE